MDTQAVVVRGRPVLCSNCMSCGLCGVCNHDFEIKDCALCKRTGSSVCTICGLCRNCNQCRHEHDAVLWECSLCPIIGWTSGPTKLPSGCSNCLGKDVVFGNCTKCKELKYICGRCLTCGLRCGRL